MPVSMRGERMRISVVIPCLDASAWLAQAIRSALNQTQAPVEVLVVDNGSSDGSAEIARGFGPPVQLLRCDRPGAAAARAMGAEAATGEALMFLDADDLLGPTVLRHLSEALERAPGGVAVCPWRRYERSGAAWVAAPASCPPQRAGQDDLAAWISGWYHPPCAVLWSRAGLDRAGGWDPAITVDDDGDLMMRALCRDVPMVRTGRGIAYYRRAPGDAVTLSGQATTRSGLSSRFRVLSRIEAQLIRAGRARRYGASLAQAFARIARDAEGIAPDLHDAALARLAAHGGNGILRQWARYGLTGFARLRERAPIAPDPFPLPERDPDADASSLVSGIIPSFNRKAKLARAIASVVAQSHDRWELIVVDDASTDGTAEMVRAMADPRIRLVRHDRNAGVAAARNTGIGAARGAFLAFLDSDDTWRPDKLARQLDLMQRCGPVVGVVYSGLVPRRDDGPGPAWRPRARGNVLPDMLASNAVHLGTSSVLMRREVAETIGGFDETLPANEDHDYWTRAARFYAFDFVPEPLIVYDQTGPDGPKDKRSLDFAANMRARDLFVSRHGVEAARFGMRHRYQLDSACRHLEWREGTASAGRRLLLKALRDRPQDPAPYVWLALSVLPRPLRSDAAARLRALKAAS